jgi:hypothetical protein
VLAQTCCKPGEGCHADKELRKLANISIMVLETTKYSRDQLIREFSKCALMHRDCHKRHTREQWAA